MSKIEIFEIVDILRKKNKNVQDYIKIFLFLFFTVMAISYISHMKLLV